VLRLVWMMMMCAIVAGCPTFLICLGAASGYLFWVPWQQVAPQLRNIDGSDGVIFTGFRQLANDHCSFFGFFLW